MIKRNKLLLPLFLACLHNTVFAGGPLATSTTNAPIVYPNGGSAITVNYDLGTLGSRTNTEAASLLDQARDVWNNVSSSTVNINRGSDLSTNVTESNYQGQLNNSSNDNPFIFDSDGGIVDDIFGDGQKDYVVGFTSIITDGTHITQGHVVINGHLTNNKTDSETIIIMAHSLGHMIGLDHTQLNETQELASSDFPLMYPITSRTTTTLHDDDIVAVSTLYPSATNSQVFGTLSGSFFKANGTPIRGANIWVRETNTNKVYSTISDYFENNTGDFSLNLPPGTYTVHAESIQSDFYAGYRVGPYSRTSTDISFQSPHPLTPIAYGQAAEQDDDEDDDSHGHHDNSPPPVNTAPPVNIVITAGNTRNITFNLSGVIPANDNDSDNDGVNDVADNCPSIFNTDQTDSDLDGYGNACDSDDDNDSVIDIQDNCPFTANSDQLDFDTDGTGNVCDTDDDNDGLTDLFEMLNGLNLLDATGINGASGDADNDGFTNIEEQSLGTDASAATGATSNPGTINFSSASYDVHEDVGTASITVTRDGGSTGEVSVLCFTTEIPGQAIPDADYTTVSTTLSWADGDNTAKTCNIPIINDTIPDSEEMLQVDISSPTGGTKLGAIDTAILSIINTEHFRNDFNGDTKADVLLHNPTTGMSYLWFMDGVNKVGEGIVKSSLASDWTIVATDDFNGDTKADILLHNPTTGMIYLWLMDGVNKVGEGIVKSSLASDWSIVATDDFNRDGKADILLHNPTTGMVYLWLMDGANKVGEGIVKSSLASDWSIVATNDFSGDSKADVLLRNATTGMVYLWLMDGVNKVGEGIVKSSLASDWSIVATNDFNGDTKADVLLFNPTTGMVYLWLMDGVNKVGEGIVKSSLASDWQIVE